MICSQLMALRKDILFVVEVTSDLCCFLRDRSCLSFTVILLLEYISLMVNTLYQKMSVSFDLHTLGIWSTAQPNGLAVPEASIHPVKTTTDVLELMSVGLTNRAVGATALNERSSRSHRSSLPSLL